MRSGKLLATNDVYIWDLLKNPLYIVKPNGKIWTRIAPNGRAYKNPNLWRLLSYNRITQDVGERGDIKYKGKTLFVHRIIYAKYKSGIGENPILTPDLVVYHKNGIASDNSLENLLCGTQAENNLHRFRILKRGAVIGNKVLSWEIVKRIREQRSEGKSLNFIRKYWFISKGHASQIVNNKIWIEGKNYAKIGNA